MLANSSEELLRANNELVFIALQHYGGFAGRERRAPLDRIRFVSENYLLPGAKSFKSFVILLWIDLVHAWLHNTSPRKP
jgi:hypothetical protein